MELNGIDINADNKFLYKVNRKKLFDAVSRGIKIFTDITDCFTELSHFSHLISNKYLFKLTKQSNYVISCTINDESDIRNPNELVNICKFFGFSKTTEYDSYSIKLIYLANYLHYLYLETFES